MSDIVTRWRAHCQVCGHISDDLRRCKNPESRDSHFAHVNILKHMIKHAKAPLDPNGTKEKAECPVCHKILESGPAEILRGTHAQHKLLIHYASYHPEEAEKWFVSTGLLAPRMEKLEIGADDWIRESKRLADEGDAKSPSRMERRKQQGGKAVSKRRKAQAPRAEKPAPKPATRSKVSVLPSPTSTGSAGTEMSRREQPDRKRKEDAVAEQTDEVETPGPDDQPVAYLPERAAKMPDHPFPPGPASPAGGKAQAGRATNRGEEFSDESLISHLRGGRIARARSDEEGDDWAGGADDADDGEGEERSLPFVRSRRGRWREDVETDEDTEEGGRGERREKGAVGRGGKIALVAVLGMAVAGLGLLLWSKMRGKAGPERIPMGNLLAGSQGIRAETGTQPVQTAVSSPQPAPVPSPAGDTTGIQTEGKPGIIMVPGRGQIGAEYADKAGKFL